MSQKKDKLPYYFLNFFENDFHNTRMFKIDYYCNWTHIFNKFDYLVQLCQTQSTK